MREVMAMFKESVPRVVVSNLPPDMTVEELCAYFAPVGKVLAIKVGLWCQNGVIAARKKRIASPMCFILYK